MIFFVRLFSITKNIGHFVQYLMLVMLNSLGFRKGRKISSFVWQKFNYHDDLIKMNNILYFPTEECYRMLKDLKEL